MEPTLTGMQGQRKSIRRSCAFQTVIREVLYISPRRLRSSTSQRKPAMGSTQQLCVSWVLKVCACQSTPKAHPADDCSEAQKVQTSHPRSHLSYVAGGNSQLVKCLLWEHEDPSSDPQSHCEKLRVVAYVYNPSTGEAETHRSLELSDQLVTPICELWVRLETLYQNIK